MRPRAGLGWRAPQVNAIRHNRAPLRLVEKIGLKPIARCSECADLIHVVPGSSVYGMTPYDRAGATGRDALAHPRPVSRRARPSGLSAPEESPPRLRRLHS